ncbi:helix-turn-helix domain-containing protein [Alteribacter aurantiacus]|uniref:helix-turn-helix domain-containing protein n=1 Tax=Alteribacter aurantiacus TaxID=254410 RepID=UPI0004274C0E|nr:helix-turn-helix domain-containing protein [Alteribacter aurantiacus]
MTKSIYDIMLNPIRMRIVKTIAKNECMTSTEICVRIKDVPRTTLYRHISTLIDAGILKVVDENKIRGSVERILAMNVDEIAKHNTAENEPQQAFRFLMNIYGKFEKYFNEEKNVPANNVVFLNNTVMMMDDQEFDQFLSELQQLLLKYDYESADGRKPRDISIISSPTESEIKKE